MPFAENDGVKIWWDALGEGEPVLLIQGLGYTSEMWHRVAPALAREFRVIVFDNRGVGRSDVPHGPYSVPMMAGDAAAVLDAAGVEHAHVYGTSMGGSIAQQLAIQSPERVRSLVLAGTYCGGPSFVPVDLETYEMLAKRAGMAPEEGIRLMIPFIYDPGTPAERIEEDLAIRLRTYPAPEGYLAQLGASLSDWDGSEAIRELRIPVLVMHGESDRLVNPANSPVIASRIPGARLVMLPNASHIYATDQPEAANDAALSFLREVSRREVGV